MVLDAHALEDLVHIAGPAHVIESPRLALSVRAHEAHAPDIRVVPGEVTVEGQQRVDKRLCEREGRASHSSVQMNGTRVCRVASEPTRRERERACAREP